MSMMWGGALMLLAGLVVATWAYSELNQYNGWLGQLALVVDGALNGSNVQLYEVAKYLLPTGVLFMGLGIVVMVLEYTKPSDAKNTCGCGV